MIRCSYAYSLVQYNASISHPFSPSVSPSCLERLLQRDYIGLRRYHLWLHCILSAFPPGTRCRACFLLHSDNCACQSIKSTLIVTLNISDRVVRHESSCLLLCSTDMIMNVTETTNLIEAAVAGLPPHDQIERRNVWHSLKPVSG